MGSRHHGHWFGKGHWHHSHHHHHHHHHHKHDYLFGSRGDDVLVGTERNNAIIGRKGNDELFGNGGNDWLDGGNGNDLLDGGAGKDKLFGGNGIDELLGGEGNDCLDGGNGNDLLDGGAGNDKVFGGRGDDIAVYSVAENADNGACGTRDFYDGGKGNDVLRLVLTADELADPDVQADIAAFQDFLADSPGGCGRNGEVFKFKSFDLAVRNFEQLEIEGGGIPPVEENTPPVGLDDLGLVVMEDEPALINVIANDEDADGDALDAVLVGGPAHGALNQVAPGVFEYTPDADYVGPDSFTYKASDGLDESALTNVTLEVLAVNDLPQLKDETDPLVWQAARGAMIQIDVLAHYDPGPADESDQTITLTSAKPKPGDPFFGNLLGINPSGNILYIAPNGVPPSGHESITFEIEDSLGAVTTAELQIDIFV